MRIYLITGTLALSQGIFSLQSAIAVACSAQHEHRDVLNEGIHPDDVNPAAQCTKLGYITQYHYIFESIDRGTNYLCSDPFGPGEEQVAKVTTERRYYAECIPGATYGSFAVRQICQSIRTSGDTLRCFAPHCNQSAYIQWFQKEAFVPGEFDNYTSCSYLERKRLKLGSDGFPLNAKAVVGLANEQFPASQMPLDEQPR